MKYKVLAFILLLLTSFQCQTETSSNFTSSYQLNANQVAWQEGDSLLKPNKITGSFILKDPLNRFSITAMDGSEGVLILLNTSQQSLVGKYRIDKASGNSIKLNKKTDRGLNVWLSEICPNQSSEIIITAHDPNNHTVSGYFEASLCSKLQPGAAPIQIKNGKFEKVNYLATDKR